MDSLDSQNFIHKQIDLGLKDQEILDALNYSSNKRNRKNQKTNQRRNELRRANGNSIKRGSKGRSHNKIENGSVYLEDITQLKYNLDLKLEKLLKSGNIIGLFKLYGVDLKESRKLYRGICPFHQENTASFTVSKSKGVAKCFGCGKGSVLLNMLFVLKFGENVRRKKWRLELLEQDIDLFIDLEPIVKFNINENTVSENNVVEKNGNNADFDDLPF